MTTNPKTAASPATPPVTSSLVGFMGEVLGRSNTLAEGGLEQMADENKRFIDQAVADAQEALTQLKACASPVDIMLVQQAWIAVRAKAYADAALRLIEGVSNGARPPQTNGSAPTAKASS